MRILFSGTKLPQRFFVGALSLLLFIYLASCSGDDSSILPEEVITDITVTVSGVDDSFSITWQDEDADGKDPVITLPNSGINLLENTEYTIEVTKVLNNTLDIDDPERNVLNEIIEFANEHQFFITADGINISGVDYGDSLDDADLPFGTSISFITGDSGTGTLTLTLIHEPIKDVNNVDPLLAGGETDFTIPFDVTFDED